MMRLVQRGLMFGNLYEVTSPALVERYNRALKHLTGKTTSLTEFHIDISGYSPEIGDEFDDRLYLNPNGCNRQFILLSPQQKTAPLLNAQFSTSRSILRHWIEENEEQLFTLTTRDAVMGELDNSVYTVDDPEKLFRIRKIVVEADTTEKHVQSGEELAAKVDRFLHEDDAWWDDVLTAEMIELAKKTGDITRFPVKLEQQEYTQDNFYTEHFGGLYIFRDVQVPAAIAVGSKHEIGPLPITNFLDLTDRNEIAAFLDLNGLTEPIVKARDDVAKAIIRQRMDFILVDVAADAGEDLTGIDRRSLRGIARRYTNQLPDEFHGLNELLQWLENHAKWPTINSEHPAYFYSIRSSQNPDRDLVNMLLAQLTPRDVRQLFICHKEAFYRAYRTWGDAKRTYVADFLANEYLMDAAAARHDLFGPEPGTDEFEENEYDRILPDTGPWGAVRRK